MSGIGGIIYGLCTIGTLLNMPVLIAEAKKLAQCIKKEQIDHDTTFDIMFGSAGLLLSLLTLWKSTKDTHFLDLAIHCGKHLCTNASQTEAGLGWKTLSQQLLLGFSHGVAGIAYALFKLSRASKEPMFAEIATQAFAHERSLFCEKKQNWPRVHPEEEGVNFVSWCHGAVGIGFSRLASLQLDQNEIFLKELRVAHAKTHKTLLEGPFSLCCGSFGRFELLLETSRQISEFSLEKNMDPLFATLFYHYQNQYQNRDFNVARELRDPSFMKGIAGIGYSLLRYLDRSLPQVLLLS